MVKLSDVVAKYLIKNNVEIVFGIIGSANSHLFDSIQQIESIKLVPVHHEQVAVMAMGAYYRTTGKLSAALVTAGGGSSNAFTGILSNWADSIPGIIISGQEQTYYIEEYKKMRMYGIQGYDSVDTYKKHTKLSSRINKENVYKILQKVFEITFSNRPGPVYLEIPFDVQAQMVEDKNIEPSKTNRQLKHITKTDVNYIIDKINSAKSPVILGGHGIKLSGSKFLFRKFVDQIKIPTLLTWSGVDLLPSNNENYYGRPGVHGQRAANFINQNCDLLIVLGSRLSLLQTGYNRKKFAPNAHIIHIDIDPSETKKFNHKNINADVKSVLTELLNKQSLIKCDINTWKVYCENVKKEFPILMPEHKLDPQNSYTFIDWFTKKIPDKYTIVTDMGTALLCGFYGTEIKPNQTMFTSLGLGEMGYGLAAAVGAGFSHTPVMCLNCDGGMMMNLQELQTIKTFNLPVKIVIFNNDGYLMIKHTQNMLFSGVKTCVDKNTGLTLPNYKKIANAFDYEYYTVENVENFLNSKTQAILEVFMNPEQEFIPKVKGFKNKDNTIQPGILEKMSPLLPENIVEKYMFNKPNKNKE
jgi:acetolactate synthase I/II/III large subunit